MTIKYIAAGVAVVLSALLAVAFVATASAATSVDAGCSPGLAPNTSNVTSSSIQVNWTDNCTDETGFFVDWNQTGTFGGNDARPTAVAGVSGSATVLSGASSLYNVTGLECDTTYYFRVVAYKVAGQSPVHYAASATISDTTLPCDGNPPTPPPGTCGPAAPAIANQILRDDYGFNGNDPQRGAIIKEIGKQTGDGKTFAANTRCEDYVAYVQSVYDWLANEAGLGPPP